MSSLRRTPYMPYQTSATAPGAGAEPSRMPESADVDRMPHDALASAIRAHLIADAGNRETTEPASSDDRDRPPSAGDVGRVRKLADGNLSEMIAACVGGLALDVLAPRNARSLALIGVGKQAEAQLEAALGLRDLRQIRIYGHRPVAATELAKQFRNKTSIPIDISSSPEEAVHNADIVILASNSSEPAIDADWVAPHAHVTSMGPRSRAKYEVPFGLVYRAKTIASDSPQHIAADEDHFLAGDKVMNRLKHIGGLIGKFNPDKQRSMTLFLSSGLADTELAALKAAADFLKTR